MLLLPSANPGNGCYSDNCMLHDCMSCVIQSDKNKNKNNIVCLNLYVGGIGQ